MKIFGGVKYCLNDRVNVLWVDETFGLAKVFFIEESVERIVGVRMITDQPYEESTLNLSVLTGGIR